MKRKIIERLLRWKNLTSEKMPMLIHGARQVGKTYAITEFGNDYYKNTVYVNFELDNNLIPYFEGSLSPDRIISILEKYFNIKIIPNETLIIFDEIQVCESALTSLKYFSERAAEYDIIAAGSLLGVAINREKFSFPVGKVHMETMYPLDFEEFLWAKDKDLLIEEIKKSFDNNSKLNDILYNEAINYYHHYLITGGMPAVVKTHISKETILTENEIKSLIINSYISDMSKYASSTESVKIKATYDSIPTQLAKENKKFQYKIIKSGARASLFGESIDWLLNSGIVLKCDKCEQGLMPPSAYKDLSSFKLYMNDVGLLSSKTGLTLKSLNSGSAYQYLGALTENYVASQLCSLGYELIYWESKGKAEVDFLIVKDGSIIPIEVKAKHNVKSKSLSQFINQYKPEYTIRISEKNFGYDNGIKSIPLFAIFCI